MENTLELESSIPDEFLDPEGEAELQDPDLVGAETSDSTLRSLWAPWLCERNGGEFVAGKLFGKPIGFIPKPAVSAYKALERALQHSGYAPKSSWSFNCRKIAGSSKDSLHSYGIAIDIDPTLNPYSSGDPYQGALKPRHVKAVLAIKNTTGASIWSWGGNWRKPDRMHFQLDRGPAGLEVDWSTVPGKKGTIEGDNVLTQGSNGEAVKMFQRRLLAWNSAALPNFGADGDYGSETTTWVGQFQESLGLTPTGSVDGVTAALLTTLAS